MISDLLVDSTDDDYMDEDDDEDDTSSQGEGTSQLVLQIPI